MILLSSAFRIDNAQNMDRTNVSPSTSSTTHHSTTSTTTWLNLWTDIATWISRKPRYQVDPMYSNTCHPNDHHSQEDVLLNPVSEFQKLYVSFPEFKETEQANNNNNTIESPTTTTTTSLS